ncbi:MAG: hypothetical protein JEZ09_17040 [Salinivirgaceae bacterium]|nr:hypothetical protein [Salinivirgaceae bacterium]
MENLETKINNFVDKHLKSKKIFNELDCNTLILNKTTPVGSLKEYCKIESPEYRALLKIFKHIYADIEKDLSNSNLWDEIYAFPQKEENIQYERILTDNSTITPINSNLEISDQFLKETLQIARDNFRNRFNKNVSNKESRFFIIGDVGTGKTTFLKFIHNRLKEKLNGNNNILWLHVDFSKEFLNKLSVPEAIKFEAARVFREKVYQSLSVEKKEDIKQEIESNFSLSSSSSEFEKYYKEYISIFEPERTEPYNHIVQSTIIKYIESNYPVIYIVDGLDKLSEANGFREKLKDVQNIVSDGSRNGMFYFVMRKESHLSFLDTLVDIKNSKELARISNDFKKLEIKPAQLTDIVFNRFNLLLDQWETIVHDNRSSILDQDNETEVEIDNKIIDLISKLKKEGIKDKASIEAYFGMFMIFLLRGIKPEEDIDFDKWEIKTSISALKDLIGNNFRKLMEAINTIHKGFIESIHYAKVEMSDVINIYNLISKEKSQFFHRKNSSIIFTYNAIMRRDYRVIPLLLENNSHYNHPYTYSYDDIEKKIKPLGNRLSSKFIYSVFYPVNSINHIGCYNLLLKIRILQFMAIDPEKNYTKDVIVSHIKSKFPYKVYDIKLAINELFKSDLINIDIIPNGYSLKINRIGENHLNYLIHDFGYLRIILDDILIPEKYENFFLDIDSSLYSESKQKWIINQIPRVALFISLISKIEKWDLSNIEDDKKNEWSIVPGITDSFKNRILRICKRPDPDLTMLENAFRNHMANLNSIKNA